MMYNGILRKQWFILLYLWIATSPSVPSQTHYAEKGLAEYSTAHLAGAFASVDKDDGYFLYAKSYFVGREFHFYLECITLEANFVKLHGLEHFPTIAFESGCGVVNFKSSDKPYVF